MRKRVLSIISVFLILGVLFSCSAGGSTNLAPASVTIKTYDRVELVVGDTLQLEVEESGLTVQWSASSDAATVTQNGLVTAVREGKAAITASCGDQSDSVMVEVVLTPTQKPTVDIEGYKPAGSYLEALARSEEGMPSGSLTVPDQAPVISPYRPMKDGKFILNTASNFIDENTYVVVDAYGNEVFRVYRGGGYIALEEIAAYVYAFGDVPANYIEGKNMDPANSIWGAYLRLNHTKFSGDTKKYPYEPVLPNISGCGGSLNYYEIDIGTTGTDCDPSYTIRTYNDGERITRGAARIVYGKYDLNGNGVYEFGEQHVFYTYNHYNDFQEYLNYYGGWGEMFGNITGGGKLSSKTNYNPTPYVMVVWEPLVKSEPAAQTILYYYDAPKEYFLCAA